jgi:prepilin-type N-terminal cleavage/methylation domain-containing protein
MTYSISQNPFIRKKGAFFNLTKSGFTLIELLVVIAIIAILAVMGFAAFTGLTGRGNDGRRNTDIKAIGDALEVRRGNNTAYQTIFATDFATGKFPAEPTGRMEKYCYTDGTAAIPNPAPWSNTACPSSGSGTGTAWMVVSGAVPTVSNTATYYKICTVNEAKDAVICRGSRQ